MSEQIVMSDMVKVLLYDLHLNDEEQKWLKSVYYAEKNLGNYENFLPYLKGKRGRKQLYDAIKRDIERHILGIL